MTHLLIYNIKYYSFLCDHLINLCIQLITIHLYCYTSGLFEVIVNKLKQKMENYNTNIIGRNLIEI